MRKLAMSLALATLMTAPVQAADWRQSQAADIQAGAFAGARVRLSLGGTVTAKPRAALTFAPTMRRTSSDGVVRTSIGEGLALNFGSHAKPMLTLAGVRADVALGLKRQGKMDGDQRLGMSKGSKIAIGVAAVVVAGAAIGYVVLANRCTECDQ